MDKYIDFIEWINRTWDQGSKEKFDKLRVKYDFEKDANEKELLRRQMREIVASKYDDYSIDVANDIISAEERLEQTKNEKQIFINNEDSSRNMNVQNYPFYMEELILRNNISDIESTISSLEKERKQLLKDIDDSNNSLRLQEEELNNLKEKNILNANKDNFDAEYDKYRQGVITYRQSLVDNEQLKKDNKVQIEIINQKIKLNEKKQKMYLNRIDLLKKGNLGNFKSNQRVYDGNLAAINSAITGLETEIANLGNNNYIEIFDEIYSNKIDVKEPQSKTFDIPKAVIKKSPVESKFVEKKEITSDDIVKWIIDRVNNKDLNYKYKLENNNKDFDYKLTRRLEFERLMLINSSNGVTYESKICYAKAKKYILKYKGDLIRDEDYRNELISKIDELFYEEVKVWLNYFKGNEKIDAEKLINTFKIFRTDAAKVIQKLKDDNILTEDNLLQKFQEKEPLKVSSEERDESKEAGQFFESFKITEDSLDKSDVKDEEKTDKYEPFDFSALGEKQISSSEKEKVNERYEPLVFEEVEEVEDVEENVDEEDIDLLIEEINDASQKSKKLFNLKLLNQDKFINGKILGIPMKLYKNILGLKAHFLDSIFAKKINSKSKDMISVIRSLSQEELNILFKAITNSKYGDKYVNSLPDLAWREILQRVFDENYEKLQKNFESINIMYNILLDYYKELREIDLQLRSDFLDNDKRMNLQKIFNDRVKDINLTLKNMRITQNEVREIINPDINSKSLKYVWDNIVKSEFKTYGKNDIDLFYFNGDVDDYIDEAESNKDIMKEMEFKIFREKINNDYFLESNDKNIDESLNLKNETEIYVDTHEEYFERLKEWQSKGPLYKLMHRYEKPNEIDTALDIMESRTR